MATETIAQGTDSVGGATGGFGCFFKFGHAPSNTTALLDIEGVSGYHRVSLQPGMTILYEPLVTGWSIPNVQSTVLAAGTWYWIAAGAIVDGNMGTYSKLYIERPGTVFFSSQPSNGAFHSPYEEITGLFGVGVPISSAYDPFPYDVAGGWLWSKPRLFTLVAKNSGGGVQPAPTSDWTGVGTNGGAWNCREAVGTQPSLADASDNHVPLLAGPQGLTVTTEGPYA